MSKATSKTKRTELKMCAIVDTITFHFFARTITKLSTREHSSVQVNHCIESVPEFAPQLAKLQWICIVR